MLVRRDSFPSSVRFWHVSRGSGRRWWAADSLVATVGFRQCSHGIVRSVAVFVQVNEDRALHRLRKVLDRREDAFRQLARVRKAIPPVRARTAEIRMKTENMIVRFEPICFM
jgi:hypothetical protein